MKIYVFAATAALALGGTASAQTASGMFGAGPWSGPYVGVHGGGEFDDRYVITSGALAGNINNVANGARPQGVELNRDGYLGGGQVGVNYQTGMFVVGLEADASALHSDGTTVYGSPTTFGAALAGTQSAFNQKADYLATARARVGVANDKVFVYGTGGYAQGDVTDSAVFYNSAGAVQFAGSKNSTLAGYAIGGGVEAAVLPTFGFWRLNGPTLRVEYLHYDLGDKLVNVAAVPNVGAGGYSSLFHNTSDVVRAGVNFKF